MKGKRQFSTAEVVQIREILVERPRTKGTRDKLRAIGFFISDYGLSSPFGLADFERLIAAGEIKIVGSPASPTAVRNVMTEHAAPAVEPPEPDAGPAERARRGYRPPRVRCLLVGESAPAGGTFFYFANSVLFRQTRRAFWEVFGDACGEGEAFLRFFRDRGFFLDDLCPFPVNGLPDDERVRARAAGVATLAARLSEVTPETVIVVMKAIRPEVEAACARAGVGRPALTLPFPRPEHQAQYIEGLATFLRTQNATEVPKSSD